MNFATSAAGNDVACCTLKLRWFEYHQDQCHFRRAMALSKSTVHVTAQEHRRRLFRVFGNEHSHNLSPFVDPEDGG